MAGDGWNVGARPAPSIALPRVFGTSRARREVKGSDPFRLRTAVITIVAGRHEHLVRQRAALEPSVHHVVVGMGDGEAERVRSLLGEAGDVIAVLTLPRGLPLAQARNAGARHALAATEPGRLRGPLAHLPPAPLGGYLATGLDALAPTRIPRGPSRPRTAYPPRATTRCSGRSRSR